MQGVCVVVSVLLGVQSAYGFGWGGGGGGCGCAAPPPPAPCGGGAQAPPVCPPPPPCPTAICPPQPIYEECPVCPPIPVYEVPACPPCPAPPQTICVAQQIPAPPPPPPPPPPAPISAPVSSCCSRSPCGRPCARQLRILGAVIHDVAGTEQDPTCNSKTLKTILEKSISDDTETSKHAIHNETLALKGKHDVICANSDFSYIVNSNSFCQLTKNNITCYVFKQT